METWDGIFPRCSKILYWLLDGVDGADEAGGPVMLNHTFRVVTTHSLLGPWMLITFTEGSFSDMHPMRLP